MGKLIEKLKWLVYDYSIKKGVAKGSKIGAGAVVALVAANAAWLEQYGIKLDLNALEIAVVSSIAGVLGVILNWVKVKLKIG